jgi:AcrR family transcriptional regulator
MTRAEKREETRQSIVEAAVVAFAEGGFDASSTRDIAKRAGVTQGLLTYHFASKDDLWRAAADRIFGQLGGDLPERGVVEEGPAEAVRSFVRFGARHPELFHFMVDAGRHADERMRWLVETHLEQRFAAVAAMADSSAVPRDGAPHVYYALVGAASLIFAVAPECRALTGVDPLVEARIERHADLIAALFVPD